ncbi:toll-like receptor 13 [Micropterus salmoides]|uniref:toll-like receptor 13 n=1 Tax=Micropterus salmoides TaxID=27706 RepID=UPI0018ECF130|nr:toll-like receptor 13 [Micropterus salmoides]XP_038580256.1 toll-like receptor 13 [Micropterus salmoides]
MSAMGRFLVFLLSFLLHFNPSLAYSLKNCTAAFAVNVIRVECTHRGLAAVPDDIPKNATSLDLSSNRILKINRTDLSSLAKLTSLNTENNHLAHVDNGAFAGLPLMELKMGSNKLTNLTDNMFQGLWTLIYLSAEKNHLAYISPLAFQPLISLQNVVLNYNRLHQMSNIVPILQLPNLKELYLDFNHFTSIQSDDLPFNKSNLRTLMMIGNILTKFSIRRDIFPHLQSIFMSTGTDFEWDVPDATFLRSLTALDLFGFDSGSDTYRMMLKSAESVRELSMSVMKNQLDEDLVDIACQLPTLTSLELSNNNVNSINNTFLQSCSQLIELDLSYNSLEELSEFSLSSMKQLRRLDLNTNFLSRVPPALKSLSTLEILDLSVNFISELGCSDFLNLTRLTTLDLNQNRISTLNGCVFQDLKDLKVLNMGENSIHLLIDFFKVNLQKLEVLNLHMNSLKQLKTGDFRNLSSLRSLNLESEKCYVAHKGAFEGLTNLHSLSVTPFFADVLSFTGLENLEILQLHLRSLLKSDGSHQKKYPPFSKLPSLKSLLIENSGGFYHISPDLLKDLKSLEYFAAENFFTEPPHPDTFKYTPHLTSLQIIQSDLQNLNPDLFQPIPNLQALDLSQNKLRSLDFLSQVNLSSLSQLSLRQNKLTVINETILQSLPALTFLDLFGNPLTCNCSNAGFIQWVKNNNQTQVVNAYQYHCSFPSIQQGTRLLDFDIQSCWMDVGFLCFICSTCLTLLTLLAAFVFHFLRWQLAYAYYLFLAFLYDSRKKKKNRAPHQYDAFISYNVHDEAWVYREMLPVLEGEQGWRLCLHHRDFQPGKPIMDNITDAIYGSRKTVCVISQRYLQSEWCSREIQMASFRLFDKHKDVLILLFLEEIPAQQLSPYYRMRKLVKGRTYLSWPQAGQHKGVFWQNVSRALETGDAPTETADLLTGPAGC